MTNNSKRICPKCSSNLAWFQRREMIYEDDGHDYLDFIDYEACSNMECDYEA